MPRMRSGGEQGDEPRPAFNARVIAGATPALFARVRSGELSAALFYRLNVIHLQAVDEPAVEARDALETRSSQQDECAPREAGIRAKSGRAARGTRCPGSPVKPTRRVRAARGRDSSQVGPRGARHAMPWKPGQANKTSARRERQGFEPSRAARRAARDALEARPSRQDRAERGIGGEAGIRTL
jgi:hypothetical protein